MSTGKNYPEGFSEGSDQVLASIEREVERQLEGQSQMASAVATRAALLVSTAVVFVALPGADVTVTPMYTVGVLTALAAAIFGVWSLFRKRHGTEVDVNGLDNALWDRHPFEAIHAITEQKRQSLDEDRERVESQYSLVKIGYLFLTMSLFTTVLHVAFGL